MNKDIEYIKDSLDRLRTYYEEEHDRFCKDGLSDRERKHLVEARGMGCDIVDMELYKREWVIRVLNIFSVALLAFVTGVLL